MSKWLSCTSLNGKMKYIQTFTMIAVASFGYQMNVTPLKYSVCSYSQPSINDTMLCCSIYECN